MDNLVAFLSEFFPDEVAQALPWVLLALPVAEALLRLGERLARLTQPTWDDEAVARGIRVLELLKMAIGRGPSSGRKGRA